MPLRTLRQKMQPLSARLPASAALLLTVALAGCAGIKGPGSVKAGECRIFDAPKFVVLGKTQYDQDWIDGSVEGGIGGCRWTRPLARPASFDAAPVTSQTAAASPPKPKKRKLIQRIRDAVLPRPRPVAEKPYVCTPHQAEAGECLPLVAPPVAAPPDVVAEPPALPPQSPLDALLHPRK